MSHRLDPGSKVHKDGKFGVVDVVVERVVNGTLQRIFVVHWSDGTVTDEDEAALDTVIT